MQIQSEASSHSSTINLFGGGTPLPSTKYYVSPSTTNTVESMDREEPEVNDFVIESEPEDCSSQSQKSSLYELNTMMKSASIQDEDLWKQNKKDKTDRFIPIRRALSMETSPLDMMRELDGGTVMDENAQQSSLRGKQISESKIGLDEMYKALFLEQDKSKTLQFGSSALTSSNILNTTNLNNLADNTHHNIPLSSKKKILTNPHIQKRYLNSKYRKINKTPFKVLDAPNLQDDFYLNLLEWSSTNILSVALDSSLYFWNANNNRVLRFCDMAPDSISSLNWNDSGTHIGIGTSKGTTEIWDVEKSTRIYDISGHSQRVSSLAWKSNLIATGSRDKTINLHDIRQNPHEIINTYTGHSQQVCGLKWSFDGSRLASGGNDNKLMVWNSYSKTPICRFSQHGAAVKALAWSPHNYGVLASGGGSADRTIKFWDVQNAKLLDSIDTGSQVCNLMFSKTTKQLVSTHGYSNNEIIVWKYPTLEKVTTLTGHTSRVLFLAMNPSGETIVTGAGDETLRFWSVFPNGQSVGGGSGGVGKYSFNKTVSKQNSCCLSSMELR